MTTNGRITPTIALDELHANIDALGREINVGDTVRSFDFCMNSLMSDGTIGRTENVGDYAAYVVGVVEAIGTEIEGCPRYAIRPIMRRSGQDEMFYGHDTEACFYPPVNGTRALLGDRTCGVFKIEAKRV